MAVTTGARPASLDGCWSEWAETDIDTVIRTEMDSGTIKSRRRFTGRQRTAEAMVVIKSDKYQDFVTWFEVNCKGGAIPTRMKTPYGSEEVWAFAAPPKYQWIDAGVLRVSANLYQLPGWV